MLAIAMKSEYQYDKLECDLHHQYNNNSMENERVQKLLESGSTRSSMWLQFGQ